MVRCLGRGLLDWRNGATVLATVLVILVGYVVLDGSHTTHQALSNQRRTSVAATRRIDLLTNKIDDLQTELDKVLAATSDAQRLAVVSEANARRAATSAAFAQAATTTTTVAPTTPERRETTTTTRQTTTTTTQKPSPTTTTTGSTTTTTAPRRRCVLPGIPPGCSP